MRRLFSLLCLTTLLSGALGAQTPPKKAGRLKQIITKMADTAATSAAASATESLLGPKAASVAGLVGAQPAAEPSCPAGTVMIQTPGAAGVPGASVAPAPLAASPGELIVGAAKKKFLGKKPDAAATTRPQPVAGAPQFSCATPQQVAATQSGQASAAPGAQNAPASPGAGAQSVTSGIGSMLAATPQGMLVTAAAPIAGKGIKALGLK